MNFINIIINNSQEKLAKLYTPAYKASLNPENGITIQNKSAYHVIKDCAQMAYDYLPIYIFEKYKNPFIELKGKFKKEDIVEFTISSKGVIANRHLLCIIIDRYLKGEITKTYTTDTIKDIEPNDPYGEYGSDSFETINKNNTTMDPYDILCEAFGVNLE
jgi:hypothetical protein